MPVPPSIPGFYWDAERKKYFKIVNGAINEGATEKYHHNRVQADTRRRETSRHLRRAKSKSKRERQLTTGNETATSLALLHAEVRHKSDEDWHTWSADLPQALTARKFGLVTVEPSGMVNSINCGAFGITKKTIQGKRWVCYSDLDATVEYLETQLVATPNQIYFNGEKLKSPLLEDILLQVSNQHKSVEVLKDPPKVCQNVIFAMNLTIIEGSTFRFPQLWILGEDFTLSFLRLVSSLSDPLRDVLGLNHTVITRSGSVQTLVTRINELLEKQRSMGLCDHDERELNRLFLQIDGREYWYTTPVPTKEICENVVIHTCRKHLIIGCSRGSILVNWSGTNLKNYRIWSTPGGRDFWRPIASDCFSLLSFILAYASGILLQYSRKGNPKRIQTSRRITKAWISNDSIYFTSGFDLHQFKGGIVTKLCSFPNDNDAHQHIILTQKYAVISCSPDSGEFMIVDLASTEQARFSVATPTDGKLRTILSHLPNCLAFSYPGSLYTLNC